ncbi:MAG: hypothetical protein AAB538_03150, partial [Patescibacteria group bacterium]
MKHNRFKIHAFLFAALGVFLFSSIPVSAELTRSSGDTPEKRQFLAACQGAAEAAINAQLQAKTIDIYKALERKSEERNKCADQARTMPGPVTAKPAPAASPKPAEPDLFTRTVTRAPASQCAALQASIEIAKNETLDAPDMFDSQKKRIIPKGVRGEVYGEDTIAVPEGYYAVVTYQGHGRAFLKSGSSMKLECPQGPVPRVSIIRGIISYFWPKSGTPNFKFEASSNSIVAAIKGTEFAFDATDSKDTVYVFEGTVEPRSVSRPDEKPRDVTA